MKKFFYLVFILALLSAAEAYGQGGGRQSSFNRDKLYWTAWDYSAGGIPKSFYDSAKFNTVIRQAKAGTVNNLNDLIQYQNIFAANTNAQDSAGDVRQYDPNVQLDWLYAVTGGYYNEFYASRADDFSLAGQTTNQEFCLERGTDYFGDKKTITINGEEKECFSSGIDEAYKDKILVRGPHYYQHQGYELYSQDMDRPITYNAKFIIYPGDPTIPLNPQYNAPCVRVSVYFTDTVRQFPYDQSAPLMTRVYRLRYSELSATQLMNNPNQTLDYIYDRDTNSQNIIIQQAYMENEKLGTEFVVEWLGNVEVLVHKVEFWDQDIWGRYGKDGTQFDNFKFKADSILRLFSNDFKIRLRGWQSLNEPHTVDLLRSFRFVDSLCNAPGGFNTAPMFTMFYPNWNNNIDGRDFLKQIISIAKPNPLFYWYYPFDVGYTDLSGLYNFHTKILHTAAKYLADDGINHYYPDKDWYYTAQSWGYRKAGTSSEYYKWRQPSGQALRASILAALAYGCKGIFIEPFNTYKGDEWNGGAGYWTEGLFEITEDQITGIPLTWNSLGKFVRDSLSHRMTGVMSTKLAKLQLEKPDDVVAFTDGITQADLKPGVVYGGDITDYSCASYDGSINYDQYQPEVEKYYLLASTLHRKESHPYYAYPYKALFFVNLITETDNGNDHRTFSVLFKNPWPEYGRNMVVRDAETGETFSYSTSLYKDFTFYLGDGKMYELAPAVHIGGTLIASDELNTPMVLIDHNLVINSGVEFTVNSNYVCYKNIIIRQGGKLKIGANGKITFHNGAQIINIGSMLVDGGEIDFSSPTANNCVMVQDGAELIINGGIISNGRYGINLNGKATVKVTNATISNCQDAILLFDFGAGIPSITGCNISGCINGNKRRNRCNKG